MVHLCAPAGLIFTVALSLLPSSSLSTKSDGVIQRQPRIVSGQGDYKYAFMPDLLDFEGRHSIDLNGHGLSLDPSTGDIYFTFQPTSVNSTTRALVRFSPDGSSAELIGKPGASGLSAGTPHGLHIEHDEAVGASFLYHANNQQIVSKTDTNGQILWRTNFSNWKSEYPQYWPIMPTDAIVVPGTDLLLVADGYGS